jgi:hypothetical protein
MSRGWKKTILILLSRLTKYDDCICISTFFFYSRMKTRACAHVHQFVLKTTTGLHTKPLILIIANPNFTHVLPVQRNLTNKTIKNCLEVRCRFRELPHNGLALLPWSRHLSSAPNLIQLRASYNTANRAPSFADYFHRLVLPSGSRRKQ